MHPRIPVWRNPWSCVHQCLPGTGTTWSNRHSSRCYWSCCTSDKRAEATPRKRSERSISVPAAWQTEKVARASEALWSVASTLLLFNVSVRNSPSASIQLFEFNSKNDYTIIIMSFFTIKWPCCIVTNFFIIKPTRCTNFTNLFWHETLHVSDSSSVHHQEFIHCSLSNGICHTGL